MFTAQDVMHSPVPSISARESFAHAVAALLRHAVDCVLVPPEGRWRDYGIVTKYDLLASIDTRRRDPWQLRVADMMTTPVLTVGPRALLTECARLMAEREISNLPVFEGGRPVGVLSAGQVFAALEARGWGSEVEPALRRAARARVAARLRAHVPNPEGLVDDILAELER